MNSSATTNALLGVIAVLLAFIAWVLFSTRPVTMGELKSAAGTSSAQAALDRQPTVFVNDGHLTTAGQVELKTR